MKLWRAGALAAWLVVCGETASAHRIDEYLQATVVSLAPDRLDARMRMIPGVVVSDAVIAAIDRDGDGNFSDAEERAYAQRVLDDLSIGIDGGRVKPTLVSWRFPDASQMREGLGEIRIGFEAALPHGGGDRVLTLANRHMSALSVYLMNAEVSQDRTIGITAQKRNAVQSVYELDYRQGDAAGRVPGGWLEGFAFAPFFWLGMRHIAEGTDHVLFLLTLLLPAPLLASGGRWRGTAPLGREVWKLVGIVTAFTVGHSITLGVAAMGFVQVPERPVEVLIALSILVSALHAVRPLFAGRETWIAGFFGLVHGLAFAATLERLELERWARLAGVVSFNLGIEAMQMAIVCAALPALLLLSRTRAYPAVRIGGAVCAGAASVVWIVERGLAV